MAKLTTTDLTSLTSNETSAINTINANMAAIEAAMELTVSRDGTATNTLTADLDFNSKQTLNLAAPTIGGNAVNKTYGDANYGGAAAIAAAASAAAALVSENAAAADLVLTDADTVATAADAVSTAADAVSTASSAAAAAASAAGIYWKEPCVNATTANISLTGEQTIDGILTATSRILVKDQSSALQNGVYVTAAGAWSRAVPLDTWDEHVGASIIVSSGTANADSAYICTVDTGGTLETTSITWAVFGGGDLISTNNLSDVANAATSATNLGLGTGDSPQFTGVNVGAATDTTVTRSAAGIIAVEGDVVPTVAKDTSWTGSQRCTTVALTDGTLLDMNTAQDWDWTPAANITNGQRGMILLNNPSAYAITKAAAVHCDADFLATVSAAGVYAIAYWTDASGSIVYVMASQALAT